MSQTVMDLPELAGPQQIIRIPPEVDVPITARVRQLLDTPALQRLKEISQLGLVSCAYPGARHSRFEHSLGVYRLGCLVLQHLARVQPEIIAGLNQREAKVFLLAALLHDVGHWPYCHPLEDMGLPEIASHEQVARRWITEGPLARAIQERWEVEAAEVADFLTTASPSGSRRLLQNILNGPIDVDKMDYLQRDSLHAGVPYGRNFDLGRLLTSLRVEDEAALAITAKGKTAAEMLVFSRYVMFSEVYWHHSVRSATAMLQRLVFRLRDQLRCQDWYELSDGGFQTLLRSAARIEPGTEKLWESLFGRQRQLYKRGAQFSVSDSPEVHAALSRRPFEWLVRCAELLGQRLSRRYGLPIGGDDILIDAPPVKLEIQFRLNVLTTDGRRSLADVSPVVRALATDQFDNFVKQVRIFITPQWRERMQLGGGELTELVLNCAAEVESGST